MKLFQPVPNEYVLYRLTPHQSVLNSTTRKFVATLHDVFSMYDSPLSRLSWVKPTLYYRARDNWWWAMTVNSEEGSKPNEPLRRIQFYVAVTKTFADVLLTKFANHEQWSKCTIEPVPLNTIMLPDGADIHKLKYQRHNMFSLSYDYTRQTVPVREMMAVSQELRVGEFAGLFGRFETVSRRKWRDLVDYAWGVWDNDGVPQRNSLDVAKLWASVWTLFEVMTGQIRSLIEDVMAGFEKVFFSAQDQATSRSEWQPLNPERQQILVNGTLSSYTQRKRNLPVYDVGLYAVAAAVSAERRGMIVRSLGSAFNELRGDNTLQPVPLKLNIRYGADWLQMDRHDCDPVMMSTEEVAKVCQLPTREVQDEFKDELESNRRIEVEIPKVFLNQTGIYMGTATNRDQSFNIHLPTKNLDMLMTSRAFLGSPRMGKDMAAVNLVVEAHRKHGMGAVVLDVIDERNGHRGMADALRDHLPAESVIDLNLGDFDYPIYVGLDSAVQNMRNERIAGNRIATELVDFLMADDITNHQTREHLREAAKVCKGDLVGIRNLLVYKSLQASTIQELQKQGRDATFWVNYHTMTDQKQAQIYGPIITRLGVLMGDEVLRPIFCQRPNPELNIRKWMKQGKVVIYRIPSRDMGEMAVKTVMHWLVMTTFLTKLSMGGEDAPTWLVLNEPHQYLSPGFIHFCQRLLAEGPKYRLAPVFLFHNFRQLPSDFVQILLSASLNWHVFKNTNANVYQELASYLEPTFTPQTAMDATKAYHYIACWLAATGEYQTPFMMAAPKLVWERYPTVDNSWLTKRHSRMFGRSILEVERELQQRQHSIA